MPLSWQPRAFFLSFSISKVLVTVLKYDFFSYRLIFTCVNLKAEGEPEKGVVCLQHIFPQFVLNTYSRNMSSTHTPSPLVFNTYSFPSKEGWGGGGVEGAYYTIFKKKTIAAGKFSYEIIRRN